MIRTHSFILLRTPFRGAQHVLVSLLALYLLGISSTVYAETRTYQLQNRPADDIATQIRELYQGAPITVTALRQQVVVRGNVQLLDEITTLINTMDVALAQLRITVRSQSDISGKRSGAGVSTSQNQIGVSAERKTISTGNSHERSLIVQDGQTAQINSGQVRTLPLAIRGGHNPAAVLQQVETRSGFLISPQVISNQAIELNIVSFEQGEASMPGYETEAVVTVRRVQPGQWVSLGSTSTHTNIQQSTITYSVKSNQRDNRSFDVKVDILP
jgi:hypothetical protein